MLNLFLTALPLLGNYLFSQKNKKQSQQTIQTNQKRYEQKLSQLDSLFNRNYYSNILKIICRPVVLWKIFTVR